MSKDGRLVWSSDPELNKKCVKCKELVSECVCVPEDAPKTCKFTAVLRLEKQGRGGKTVTVIDKLPKNELFLKDLTKLIKNRCGTGGTYLMDGRDGVFEIQGDKREPIRAILTQQKIPHKGGG